jgi:hypothetical protein
MALLAEFGNKQGQARAEVRAKVYSNNNTPLPLCLAHCQTVKRLNCGANKGEGLLLFR